jgi:hypothetical protein
MTIFLAVGLTRKFAVRVCRHRFRMPANPVLLIQDIVFNGRRFLVAV